MSYTNGVGNSNNPFAAEANATSGAAPAERVASVPPSNAAASGVTIPIAVDHAKLSGFGGALAHALPQSDVRMHKVTTLQRAIADGSYSVSASDVADKIIRFMLL